MTKRIKLISILLSIALVAGILASIGLTAAIWTSPSEGETSNAVGPVIEGDDWNVWAKYFTYEHVVTADGQDDPDRIVLTEFHNDGTFGGEIGFNHHRLVIPSVIDGMRVTQIGGSVFKDTVLKDMVEEIAIPITVDLIATGAFSGLPNLVKLEFLENLNSESFTANPCVIEDFAFAGCAALNASGVVTNGRTLSTSEFAFFGTGYQP